MSIPGLEHLLGLHQDLRQHMRDQMAAISSVSQNDSKPNGTISNKPQDSEEQKKKFEEDPEYYLKYRKDIEAEIGDPLAIHKNTPISNTAKEV